MIRNELMRQDETPLEGDVEVDETAGGGRIRASDSAKGRQYVIAKMSRRPTIWAAVERGGRVRTQIVKSRAMADVEPPIFQYVLPTSMIFTDEWGGYSERIGSRYIGHRRIRHEDRVYVSGDVHTQTIEGFFGNAKNGIRGSYHSVSSRWLPSYLNEYVFRYNQRNNTTRAMFWTLLDRVRHERVGRDQGHPPRGTSARARRTHTPRSDHRSASLHPRGAGGGRVNQSDRSGGRPVSPGRLRPAGGATFRIRSSNSLRAGIRICRPLAVSCFGLSSCDPCSRLRLPIRLIEYRSRHGV